MIFFNPNQNTLNKKFNSYRMLVKGNPKKVLLGNIGRKGSGGSSGNRSMQPSILSDSILPKNNNDVSDHSSGIDDDPFVK